MTNIPFLFIPIISLICYLMLLVSLLPALNDRTVKAFCRQLLCFVFWTGGSMFMRMLAWPGSIFWYKISLASLFCIPAMLYHFLYEFFGENRLREKHLVWLLTALLVIPSLFDVYLKAPTLEALPSGRMVFRYYMDWKILIPVVLCMAIFGLAARFSRRQINSDGVPMVIASIVILAIGNLVSILPGNVFPFDTLAGIVNAGLIFWVLYRRRIFKLRIFLSPGTVNMLTMLASCCLSIPFSHEIYMIFRNFTESDDVTMLLPLLWCFSVIFTLLLNQLLRWLVQRLFMGREKQQSLLLQQFGVMATRTPNEQTLVDELLSALEQSFGNCPVCLFLPDEAGEAFLPVYPRKLAHNVKPIYKADPCAVWFANQSSCIRIKQALAAKIKIAPDKMAMIQKYNISCIVPFQDSESLQGILFLGYDSKKHDYTNDDLIFLDSLAAIISVGIKNARLYRRLFHEARTDQLTGLLNRLAFTEALEHCLENTTPFALVMLSLDDFKLYNQLYGTKEGDLALKRIAGLLRQLAGRHAILSRYSGKVFMVILPGAIGTGGLTFARDVEETISALTDEKVCRLTFSSGVYGYNGESVSAHQILEFVDVAVFEVKQAGRNGVRLYGSDPAESEDNITKAEQSCAATIYAITAAIDARDHYTFSHSQNVADYARALAAALGMDEIHTQMIYQAGLVHDVGKLAIPENILSKPGPLTPEEYEIMQGHVESSVSIIRNLPSLDYVVPAAITHHERWDGKGYPRGLSGEEIPLSGRCLALADAFDAMTSSRAYKPAYSVEYALQQIHLNAGTQFDPALCPVFIKLVKDGIICPNPTKQS